MKNIKPMLNKKYIILFLLGVLFAFSSIGAYQLVKSFKPHQEVKEDTKQDESVTKEASQEINDDKNSQKIEESPLVQEKTKTIKEDSQTTSPPVQSLPQPLEEVPSQVISTEQNVITYLEEQNQVLSKASLNDSTLVDKVKTTFQSFYQFLFQGGTIKGYTFQELTTTAKLKAIKLILAFDKKIDQIFPSYKDYIKSGISNLKAKAVATYLEITAKVCENYQDTCTQAREDFKNMKEDFKLTFSLLKGLLSEGSNAIKEWYKS